MSLTVTANYSAENANLNRTPEYRVSFAGIDSTYSTNDGVMQTPTAITSEIDPVTGRASTGALIFVLVDVDGLITSLIAQGIGGRLATFTAGFTDLDDADFATFFTGIVENYRLTPDLTGYEITVRDPQSLTNKQIFEVATSSLTQPLTEAAADTYVHYLQTVSGKFTVTNTLNAAAFTTALDTAFGVGNWSFYATAVASVGSTIYVGDTTFMKSSGYVIIDQEIIAYSGKTSTTLTGLTRASLGSTAAAHATGAKVQEMLRIGPGHPCDLIQDIYTNTDKTGLGIDPDLVDDATFDAVKTSLGSSYEMEFRITERVNAKEFLEDQFFRPLQCRPITTGGGLLSIRELVAPEDGDSVATIDHDSIVSDDDGRPVMEWDANVPSILNHIAYRYDEDVLSGEFLSYTEDTDDLSIAVYGRQQAPTIECRGFRASLTGTSTLIANRISAALQRYRNGAPLVRVRLFLQKHLLEPGDVISLTSALLPNRYSGARGITASLFEVIRREILFDAGQVELTLLWTSFSILGGDDFNRADSVAPDYDPGNDWVVSESDLGAMKVLSNELYLGRGTTPGTGGYGIMYRPETFSANQISELTFRSRSGSSVSGPAVRCSGGYALGSGYGAMYQPGSGQIFLRKYVAQDLSAASTSLGSYAVALVDGDRVRIHAVGTAITVYLNDVVIISATDSAITAGAPGAITATGANVYNRWDNYRGGNDGYA